MSLTNNSIEKWLGVRFHEAAIKMETNDSGYADLANFQPLGWNSVQFTRITFGRAAVY